LLYLKEIVLRNEIGMRFEIKEMIIYNSVYVMV